MDANDILSFLMPVPPTSLIRKKEFPDCHAVFVKAREARDPREAGRLFSLLCRLTGFAWMVWAVNAILFSSVIITVLFSWATEQSFHNNHPPQVLTWKLIVATMLALLFVGKMMFFAFTTVSLQLADRCHECAECREREHRESGETDRKTGDAHESH